MTNDKITAFIGALLVGVLTIGGMEMVKNVQDYGTPVVPVQVVR